MLIVDVEQHARVEIHVPLERHPVGEMRHVGHVARGEDAIEIAADGEHMVVVAEIRVEGLDRGGRRSGGERECE
jgi:hypothetical protein